MPTSSRRPTWSTTLALAGLAAVVVFWVRPPDGTAAPEPAEAPLLVTSSLGATSAVLFVLDPGTKNLAAYEATPGAEGGIRLLGARKITHDLDLTQFHDQSEFSFAELRERYEQGRPTSAGDGR